MRTLACLAVLVLATPAHADSFVDLFGGISIPVAEEDWTDTVETSPKLGVRVGAFPNNAGVYVGADWMPVNTDYQDNAFADVSAHRFRLMAGAIFHQNLSNTLAANFRGGVGADIGYVSVSGEAFGVRYEDSETDTGFGFELAGGIWAKFGNMEIGGDVQLPVAMHDDDNTDDIDLDYTSIDIELLFGVRFLSR